MRAMPFAALDEIAPGTSLILAPHPDDESLGCAGLIAMASACGRPPVIVGVTDGAGSHPNSRSHPPARLRTTRAAELLHAAAILGVGAERVHFLGLPDTRAPFAGPDFDAAVVAVGALARHYHITTAFASWRFDPHCDHQATAALGEAVAHAIGRSRAHRDAGAREHHTWRTCAACALHVADGLSDERRCRHGRLHRGERLYPYSAATRSAVSSRSASRLSQRRMRSARAVCAGSALSGTRAR